MMAAAVEAGDKRKLLQLVGLVQFMQPIKAHM